jgi:hypothetical protein
VAQHLLLPALWGKLPLSKLRLLARPPKLLLLLLLLLKRPAPWPLPRLHLVQLLLLKVLQLLRRGSLLPTFGIQRDGFLEASLLVPVNIHRRL